ncbi:MAG: aminomethyltransferase family protein [Kordiimonadaceae bacterium]|nr:aminomethyltransferase family protein [Kordiimonadaceae bacterium]
MAMHDFTKTLAPSPFYDRIVAQSQTQNWAHWNGYQTPRVVDTVASEYFAVRSSCSVMDLTPMEKYRITGPDAKAFLNRLVVRDVSKLKPGRVTYVVWCNDEGKVIDDGTVFHLSEGVYRLCAQHHQLDWLRLSSIGFDVSIELETHDVAALSVQGPTSYSVLTEAGISGLETVKPFDIVHTQLDGFDITVSRTGFTGDLGYELWTEPENALALWDAIFEVKKRGLYDIRLIGLDALEMVRIEAGFIMPGWDFNTAETVIRDGYDRTPYELDLGWLVNLNKPYFTGKRALAAANKQPLKRKMVKLILDGNKVPSGSFIFDRKDGKNIGAVMAHSWSPILKRAIAYADIELINGQVPKEVSVEIYYQKELAWKLHWARAEVTDKPFWTPKRRSITPPDAY